MGISNNRLDLDKAAYTENPVDQGVDRRTSDLQAHQKLDEIVTVLGTPNQPIDFIPPLKNNDRLKVEVVTVGGPLVQVSVDDASPDYLEAKVVGTSGEVTVTTLNPAANEQLAVGLPDVGTSATYGSASEVAVVTTDTKGRISSATSTTISITKAQAGLANVDNTSDLDKPVSTAQQAALDLKYDASNPNNYIDAAGAPVQPSDIADFETTTELNARDTANRDRNNHTGTQLASTISDFNAAASAAAPVQSVNGQTGTVALVKADVGLSNVENTSDLNKPVSTATQTALDLKENIFNPNNESVFFDDFLTGINTNLGWSLTQSGAGAGSQLGNYGVAVTQKAIGVLQLDTGTTATGRVALHRAVNGFVLGYAQVDLTWRFALPTPSTPTERYVIYAGLIDNVGAGAPVDGVYFVYSDVLGPNWLCITRSNNIQTTTSTTVAPDNVHNRYRIIVNSSGTEAQFYINNVLVATNTTNIPNTSARLTGIGAKIEKLIGTTQSDFDIDYYYHKITIPGGRS